MRKRIDRFIAGDTRSVLIVGEVITHHNTSYTHISWYTRTRAARRSVRVPIESAAETIRRARRVGGFSPSWCRVCRSHISHGRRRRQAVNPWRSDGHQQQQQQLTTRPSCRCVFFFFHFGGERRVTVIIIII